MLSKSTNCIGFIQNMIELSNVGTTIFVVDEYYSTIWKKCMSYLFTMVYNYILIGI